MKYSNSQRIEQKSFMTVTYSLFASSKITKKQRSGEKPHVAEPFLYDSENQQEKQIGGKMNKRRTISGGVATVMLFTALSQSMAFADDGRLGERDAVSVEIEKVVNPDGSWSSVTQREATSADFPMLPDVGEQQTRVYPDKTVRVERMAAACSMSYTAYNPKKVNNTVQGHFDVSRSSGCSGTVDVLGSIKRENYGGGLITEGSRFVTVYPGMSKSFTATTRTCHTAEVRPWHSYISGVKSGIVNLACNFHF